MRPCSVCALGAVIDTSRSNVKWGKQLGLTEGSIRRHLKHQAAIVVDEPAEAVTLTGKAEFTADGGEFTNVQTDAPLTNWDDIFARFNRDPKEFAIVDDTVRMSNWQQSKRLDNGERDIINLYSYSARFTRRTSDAVDLSDLYAAIDNWTPEKPNTAISVAPETFVVCAADLQTGKVDFGLNSANLRDRVLASFAKAADIARANPYAEIILADLGDIVENINSSSSQRGTNDLAITEQVRLARRLMLEGIKMLAPLTPSLVYVAVPSNHGSVRIAPKSPENHVLDDYGIEIAEQLRDICAESDKLSNVTVRIPAESFESLCIETSSTHLGFAHGHQAQGPDGLGKWWQGQSHGRMPLEQADIALFGHFHSLRVQQSGSARWLMVSPASDNGSSWFTNKTGERSQAGMLSFVTSGGSWSDLRIL